jgi:hypothetical protein
MTDAAPLPLPPIALIEDFLLLALNEQSGQFYPVPRSTFDCACAAAVLMDLALHNRIDNDLQEMFVINPAPVGDALLDATLRVMALTPEPTGVARWMRQLAEEAESLRDKALQRLAARGVLRCEDKKVLWVFHAPSYPVNDRREGNAVRLRILSSLLSSDIPDSRDIVLVSLAEACGLFQFILSPSELASVTPRIAQIVKLDLVSQALQQAVEEIDAAMVMVTGLR